MYRVSKTRNRHRRWGKDSGILSYEVIGILDIFYRIQLHDNKGRPRLKTPFVSNVNNWLFALNMRL